MRVRRRPHALQANKNGPVLRNFDRFGNRIDVVDYHPTYHELMRSGIDNQVLPQLVCVAWSPRPPLRLTLLQPHYPVGALVCVEQQPFGRNGCAWCTGTPRVPGGFLAAPAVTTASGEHAVLPFSQAEAGTSCPMTMTFAVRVSVLF